MKAEGKRKTLEDDEMEENRCITGKGGDGCMKSEEGK